MVYAFGPSSASYNTGMIGTYQPAYNANGMHYPSQMSFGQNYSGYQAQPAMNQRFNAKFLNYNYIAPMNYAAMPQYQQQYQMPQNNYSYPQYSYQQYSQPSYGGYGYGYAQPTGNQDFWGNQLCDWGYDYQGYPCDRDPHQWIYDPYTGSWY